ncbi:sigma-54-dependent transcriptional regulator [Cognaticolwellia mytili]|uniref:sigma-54-dependent transcriptional regulator n=1 Tax=Cognaticolwellia mytili TaxID=1888913 RepID=UPI000A1786A6|nr:sigma-54 dependent transcriptional regulator [Cognaticolwellia mytili]
MQKTIMVVDDQSDLRLSARFILENYGFTVIEADSPQQALDKITEQQVDLMLLDMNFQYDTTSGQEGMDMLKSLKEKNHHFPVIVMTAWSTVEIAVEAIKLGAKDFIEKPWKNQRLIRLIEQQFELDSVQLENKRLKAQRSTNEVFMLGESSAMQLVLAQAQKLAVTDTPILITGENGTGKSLLASYIHQNSARNQESFVTVNMGAIPESLFESELFGHTKGAFTDAKKDRMGRFEAAQSGSLFLDEIGTIPMSLQPKLLRVLESGEFEAVGSSKTQQAEVRLIAASNIDFQQAIANGEFRQDLYYRINTIVLDIPPLRKRKEDILPLAEHFLVEKSHKYHKSGLFLSEQAKKALCQYDWPGNIRELSHVIERAVLLNDSAEIQVSGLDDQLAIQSSGEIPFMTIDEAEEQLVKQALQKSHGRVIEAGELLGLGKNAIYRRLEKYQIDPKL